MPTVPEGPVDHRRHAAQGGPQRPMALTTRRNDVEVATGLTRWLARGGDRRSVAVTGLHRPSSGYSSETVFVDASWTSTDGPHDESLVLRMPPPEVGTFPHYDLVAQGQAQQAAAGVGVPVADPVVEPDPAWLGSPFMVMARVEGHIVGAVVHVDRWLGSLSPADLSRVYANFMATLADVHRADVSDLGQVPHRDNLAELDFWADYLAWSSDGSPVGTLVDALGWCRSHRPADEPTPVLLWGDARFENMVIGDGLDPVAVLDWDMTTVGAAEHDLAWFTSLDLTMDHLFGQRPAGLPDRATTVALYEEHSGRTVRDLEWYETLAMVRSTAVMTRIGYLRLQAGEPLMLPIDDNPILDLLRTRIQ
jgi:aminoglycoside phosphotransferase (APT) family kinase protein